MFVSLSGLLSERSLWTRVHLLLCVPRRHLQRKRQVHRRWHPDRRRRLRLRPRLQRFSVRFLHWRLLRVLPGRQEPDLLTLLHRVQGHLHWTRAQGLQRMSARMGPQRRIRLPWYQRVRWVHGRLQNQRVLRQHRGLVLLLRMRQSLHKVRFLYNMFMTFFSI